MTRYVRAFISVAIVAIVGCTATEGAGPTTSRGSERVADSSDGGGLREELVDVLLNTPSYSRLNGSEQDCLVDALSRDRDVAAAVIDRTGSTSDIANVTVYLVDCAPAMARTLMAEGQEGTDALWNALTDDELRCAIRALGDGGAETEVVRCSPHFLEHLLQDIFALSSEQAACVVADDVSAWEPFLADSDSGFLDSELSQLFINCGVDMFDLGDTVGADVEPGILAEMREQCASGILVACDDLYFSAPIGSSDEDYGATCGGRIDGATPGTCAPVDSSLDTREDLARDCAAGTLSACDDLYFSAPIGSSDEDYGATCGGRTDGATPGTCAYLPDSNS